jgi:hypothetical protein
MTRKEFVHGITFRIKGIGIIYHLDKFGEQDSSYSVQVKALATGQLIENGCHTNAVVKSNSFQLYDYMGGIRLTSKCYKYSELELVNEFSTQPQTIPAE